jgi:Bacterial Ig-like domain (group 1)
MKLNSLLNRLSQSLAIALIALGLSACGGGAGGTSTSSTPTTTVVSTASSIEIATSKLELGSGGSDSATLTVTVKNASNQALPNVAVNIAANSGILILGASNLTDSSGRVSAMLSSGANKINRNIAVTATAQGGSGALSTSTNIVVSGTKISISAPTSGGLGSAITVSAKVRDSLDTGIAGVAVAISSTLNNTSNKTCVPANCSTDSLGNLSISFTPTVGGAENILLSALGTSVSQPVSIASDVLEITVPDDSVGLSKEYLIGSNKLATFILKRNGLGVPNATLALSTTSGSIAPTVTTNGSGIATALMSINGSVGERSITATHTATNTSPVVAGVSNKFLFSTVSRNAYIITINPSPSVIGVNTSTTSSQQSTLTANVRDNTANSNPVKNIQVTFSILNSASAGGTITTATAITDAAGNASTTFIAGTTQSGNSGVEIQGSMLGFDGQTKTKSAFLSVTQQALYINLAFGTEVTLTANNTLMKQNFSILVTDATGNPSSGATVNIALQPIEYYKGRLLKTTNGWLMYSSAVSVEELNANGQSQNPPKFNIMYIPPITCDNEDKNFDSIIQTGEDINNDNKLYPGVVPSVQFLGANGNVSAQTNSSGYAEFEMRIPRNHAWWSKYRIVATTQTASGGAQGVSSTIYTLPMLASDIASNNAPNILSPFGQATECTNPN